MKTSLKKLLCLLMALACIFAFAACGESNDKDTKEEEVEATEGEGTEEEATEEEATEEEATEEEATEEEAIEEEEVDEADEVEKVATKFLDAFCELEFDKASKYLADDTLFEGFEELFDIETLVATLAEEDPEMAEFTPYLEEVFTILIDKVKDTMDYEIISIEEDGDAYICTVETTGPVDMTSALDVEETLANALSDEEVEEIFTQLMEDGTITEETSEDEMMTILLDALFERVYEVLENDFEIETETIEEYLTFEKDGKDWVITELN